MQNDDPFRTLAPTETRGIRLPLSGPSIDTVHHARIGSPILSAYVRSRSGLWIPSSAVTDATPLDFGKTYLAFSELVGQPRPDLDWLKRRLALLPLRSSITAVAATLAAIRQSDHDNPIEELDALSVGFFMDPFRTALSEALSKGRIVHAPQLLMVLAKLMLAVCPDTVPQHDLTDIPLALLLMITADNLEVAITENDYSNMDSIPALSQLSVELAANQHFNATYRVDSEFALFQRRWIEMHHERPSSYLAASLAQEFLDATGLDLQDFATAGVVLWASSIQRHPLIDGRGLFNQLGWSNEKMEKFLSYVALPVDAYRAAAKRDLKNHSLDWYFTTFALHPCLQFSDYELLIIDPQLILSRCLGYIPVFDILDGLKGKRTQANLEAIRRALADYSERYAIEALTSLAGDLPARRIYSSTELEGVYRGSQAADIAVDYGDSWVIVEVSMHQPTRDTVNAVSVSALERDRDAIVNEAKQVASTIASIRQDERPLTGQQRSVPIRYYPVVVLTESFPVNPSMVSIVRDELRLRSILQEPDVAPIELMDFVEIDMVEGVAETGGPALPEIIKMKHSSNFHADSVHNYLLSDQRFRPRRPQRVGLAFERMFRNVGISAGSDPRFFR